MHVMTSLDEFKTHIHRQKLTSAAVCCVETQVHRRAVNLLQFFTSRLWQRRKSRLRLRADFCLTAWWDTSLVNVRYIPGECERTGRENVFVFGEIVSVSALKHTQLGPRFAAASVHTITAPAGLRGWTGHTMRAKRQAPTHLHTPRHYDTARLEVL